MIISIVNQKGGTGKTTIATNLSAIFAGNGKDVLLVDADPQQSALDWQRDRPDGLPHVSVVGIPSDNLRREIELLKPKYEIIIVDGGGRITKGARAVVSCADFIIVPTLASKPDATSTQGFFDEVVSEVAVVKGKVPGAILFTMLKAGTVFNLVGQGQMKGLGYPLFDAVIYNRIVYQEAIAEGMSVVEYDQKSKAAEEMRALFGELEDSL